MNLQKKFIEISIKNRIDNEVADSAATIEGSGLLDNPIAYRYLKSVSIWGVCLSVCGLQVVVSAFNVLGGIL